MSVEISSAVKKLYESVSQGLGSFLVPQNVQRLLECEMRDIPNESLVTLDVEGLDLTSPEVQQLYKNTCSRLVVQEMKKQQNIEKIIRKTEEILNDIEATSDEPISQDWMTRFFNSVEDVSEEKLQDIWSKILAQEVRTPNTFSYRMLDALTKITKHEAELFEDLCKYVINFRGTLAIINDDNLTQSYNINYGKILLLSECGLIDSSAIMSINCKVIKSVPFFFTYGDRMILGRSENDKKLDFPIYKLTTIGMQLYKIIKIDKSNKYLEDVEKYMVNKYADIAFSEHVIIETLANGQIKYNTEGKELNSVDIG